MAPAAYGESSEDELSALTPRAKKAAAPKKRAQKLEASNDEASSAQAVQPEPTKQNDFGFLEEGQDLKRPTF